MTLVCPRGHTIPNQGTLGDGYIECPYCPRGQRAHDLHGVIER